MKRLIGKFMIIAAAMTSAACTFNSDDVVKPNVDPVGETLSFEVGMPAAFTTTRALTSLGENAIGSIDILVFDDATGTFSYITAARALEVKDSTLTFKAAIAQSATAVKLVLLANIDRDDMNSLSLVMGTTTMADVQAALTFTPATAWNDGSTLIPMWGEMPNAIAVSQSTVGADFGTGELMRAVARVNVTNSDTNFNLESVVVCNAKNIGFVVPEAGHLESGRVVSASVPASASTLSNFEKTTSNPSQQTLNNMIYLAEVERKAALGDADAVYLVFKGCFNGGASTYYRFDFATDGTTLDIMRNHTYNVNIASIGGAGAADFQSATRPINAETTITVWDDAAMNDITSDGVYSLAVASSTVSLANAASTGNEIVYQTTYPHAVTAAAAAADTWITNVSAATAGKITFDVAENSTGSLRSGTITITAGNIAKVITINQVIRIEGSGTADDPYLVADIDDLDYVRERVNAGDEAFVSAFYSQTANIDMAAKYNSANATSWTPIGTAANPFKGQYDGGGKEILNLYIDDATATNQALFGNIVSPDAANSNYAGVGNLTVSGSINCASGAAICGLLNRAMVLDCHSSVTVTATGRAGGIAVSADAENLAAGAYISGCSNSGAIAGAIAGGIIADGRYSGTTDCSNTGTVNGTISAGGIIAASTYCSINKCANSGNVVCNGASGATIYAGGVVAQLTGTAIDVAVAFNCSNTGTVTTSGSVATACTGGIAGHAVTATIFNGYNQGAVSGVVSHSGGVVGEAQTATISNVYNSAAVECDGVFVGGVAGSFSGTMRESYYLAGCAADGNSFAQNAVGAATLGESVADVSYNSIGLTDAQMKGTERTATAMNINSRDYYVFVSMLNARAWQHNQNNDPAADDVMGWTQTAGSYPVFATTAPAEQPAAEFPLSGSGTEDDPYLISNLTELEYFRDLMNNAATSDALRTAHYLQTADIDMSSKYFSGGGSWTPIGDNSTANVCVFKGTYDGGGYAIRNIYIDSSDYYSGLFGVVGTSATTMESVIKNVNIAGGSVKSQYSAGGIVAESYAIIINCSNSSSVTTSGSSCSVGGIVAVNFADIVSCYNTGVVMGTSYAGGICGMENIATYNITGCYNTGAVSKTGSGTTGVGAIIGQAQSQPINCYYLAGSAENGWGSPSQTIAATALTDEQMKGAYLTTPLTVGENSYYSFLEVLNAAAYLYNNPTTGTAPTVQALGWTQTAGSYPALILP